MREKKRGEAGGKIADRGIFQRGFLSISVWLSEGESVAGCGAGWRVVRQRLECEQSGRDERMKRHSTSPRTSGVAKSQE